MADRIPEGMLVTRLMGASGAEYCELRQMRFIVLLACLWLPLSQRGRRAFYGRAGSWCAVSKMVASLGGLCRARWVVRLAWVSAVPTEPLLALCET